MSRTTRCCFVFLCCVLAVPTCVYALELLQADRPFTALLAGALLGCAHVVARPLLRFVTRPIGCLTFGLSGLIIDVGLIYGCAYVLEGFVVPDAMRALLSALVVNAACWIVGGRH